MSEPFIFMQNLTLKNSAERLQRSILSRNISKYSITELISRSMVIKLEPLTEENIFTILKNALIKKEGLGEIGHVANSAYTVIGESMSAGRIYDKIGDTAKAKVVLVTPNGTICSLSKKKVKILQ